MKSFILKIFLYGVSFIILIFILLILSSTYIKNKNFKNSQTESNTLIINENDSYDLVILGISHARNFSRYGNHEKMECILDKKIINLGQGGGNCGINEQLFYLDYFYKMGNKTKEVYIVLTPPMLSSEKLPISSKTFEKEVFSFAFLYNYLCFNSVNKRERITNYLQSKFHKEWLYLKPDLSQGKKNYLTAIDSNKINDGFKLAYQEKINYNQFNESCSQVIKIIELAQKNGSNLKLFVPPALFGKWLEHNQTIEFLNKVEKEYNCNWQDYSESVTLPELYYDHHHLNTRGVIYFLEHYLKTFINE